LSLRSGRRFHGFQWTELAIPEWVINRIRKIADNEHAPKLDAEGCPVFQIDQDAPLPYDFYEEYEPDEQEYEGGERRDDADGEEQVEIAEDNMTLDDEQAEIEEDDSEYITEESRSDQSGDEDSRSEAEEARPVRARVHLGITNPVWEEKHTVFWSCKIQ